MTELLIASAIGFMVILVVGQVDVTRVMLADQARGRATEYREAVFAVNHMLKQLENADRIILLQTGDSSAPPPANGPLLIQFRVPDHLTTAAPGFTTPGGPDNPSSYTWKEYRYEPSAPPRVFFYDNTDTRTGGFCNGQILAMNITGAIMHYKDESPAPAGGVEPLAPSTEDNNVLGIELKIQNPSVRPPAPPEEISIRSEVTMHSGAYTTAANGLANDPAFSVAPPTVCF